PRILDILYPIGFLTSLSGLIGWFYFQDKKATSRLMSQIFLGGFLIYLVSLGYSSGSLKYKFIILFRDLMVLGLVSQFFSFFRKNKILFAALLAVLYGIFYFKYMSVMQNTFPEVVPPSQTSESVSPPPSSDAQWQEVDGLRLAKEGELLVEVKENQQVSALQSIIDQYGLTYRRAFQPEDGGITDLDDYLVVDVPAEKLSQLKEIEQAFYDSGLINWVEENEMVLLDDPQASASPMRRQPDFQLNDPQINRLWGFEAMGVDRLNRYLQAQKIVPKRKAAIFILDTGIDAKHEDIAANYKSLQSKYDNDPAQHGTHCAGIAAAVSNNGKGIASFSPDNQFVTVTSIKVLRAFGGGTQNMIINGMIEAADNGADVISMSLGGPANRQRTLAYQKAVQYANKKGAIVVVAAGNSKANANRYAPANTPGVITVSAIDSTLNRAFFSNTVQDLSRGIAAPGLGIYSTIPGNKYASFNGTSMATPYVAGLLGILKSIQPSLDTDAAYNILRESGKKIPGKRSTGRLIQVDQAVKMLQENLQ
ncbi:MAG: S8 family serine peptidase, partial [Bacteroidota bacterium]